MSDIQSWRRAWLVAYFSVRAAYNLILLPTRLHLIRFHGVLAPNAKLRAAVIPQPAQTDSAQAHEHTHGQAARMSWAPVLEHMLDIDVERCACGGQLKILAATEEPVVIVSILTHLGLAARATPRAAAREFSLDYAA